MITIEQLQFIAQEHDAELTVCLGVYARLAVPKGPRGDQAVNTMKDALKVHYGVTSSIRTTERHGMHVEISPDLIQFVLPSPKDVFVKQDLRERRHAVNRRVNDILRNLNDKLTTLPKGQERIKIHRPPVNDGWSDEALLPDIQEAFEAAGWGLSAGKQQGYRVFTLWDRDGR